MKMTKPKKIIIISVITVAVVISFAFFKANIRSASLTKEQIASLRYRYPISTNTPQIISMRKATLEELISISDSFVYAEVIGDATKYYVDVSLEDNELEAKRESYGIGNKYEFFEYPLSIIDDSENIFNEGDTITITANSMLENYYPKLEEGMRIVVPVARDPNEETRNYYMVDGMFYVTDDDYVLSAFEENAGKAKSGIKVETLLRELKK